MATLRLRTQLLLAMVLLTTAVLVASLLLVRLTVKQEVAEQVNSGITSSVRAFENVQEQQESQLSRSAAMLAELPPLKALMTTEHAPTIQDGSAPFWHLAGSDLFVLAKNDGTLLAFHAKDSSWTADTGIKMMRQSAGSGSATWWYSEGNLYRVFFRPITVGAGIDERQLGWIAVGYEVDKVVAQQLAAVSRSEIVLATGNRIIASTISLDDANAHGLLNDGDLKIENASKEVALGHQRFQAASVMLDTATPTPIRCFVLLPLQQSTAFLMRLNRTLVFMGAAAVLLGALIFSFISRAITRPLENLVAGTRALAAGDYDYFVSSSGSREVAELGIAFGTMRTRLLDSQRRQIEAERLAALGRTASSISHDLRHYLAALVANAEFLYEAESLRMDREEIYREIKLASDQMIDLIDSLRELSREQGTISLSPGRVDTIVLRAADAIRARPECRSCVVSVNSSGEMEGSFDSRKLERVFFNLLLNACEARSDGEGRITVEIASNQDAFDIRVRDNGTGIPQSIRKDVFDPFVSSGKPNGTGLGLAIVNKIVRDHGGAVEVEESSTQGTVIHLKLPRSIHAPEIAPSPVQT